MRVKVIAEAGVNHNGDLGLAKELVAAAAAAQADVVKFQTFKAAKLVTKTAEKAEYQKLNSGAGESQYDMLKRLELDEDMHKEIIECCDQHNIQFLSTAFDNESLEYLVKDVGLQTLKLPSGDLTNGPFIHDHAKTGADIILSTGMGTLGEIEAALAVLAHGYCAPDAPIESLDDCYRILTTATAQDTLRKKVTLLHCTSSYPAPPASINLRAMITMQKAFGLDVGYSDHSDGTIAAIAAVAMGAAMIEKHFTLDKNMEGPDHKASLEPAELKEMIENIRITSQMLGSEVKMPQPAEYSTRTVARRSLIASQNIRKGEVFSEENMSIMRPYTGASPMSWWSYLNRTATRDYFTGESIE